MSKFDSLIEHPNDEDGDRYAFPDVQLPADKVAKLTNAQLIKRLASLVADVQGAARRSKYEDERKRYIALHRALNEKGVVPPRFRPTLSAGSRSGQPRSLEANRISNDHQALDLHWLHLQGGMDAWIDGRLSSRWSALAREEFDVATVSLFVGTAGSTRNKAEILCLGTYEQLQLRAIQTEAVRKWWDRSRKDREEVRMAVIDEARRTTLLRGKESRWAQAWLAIRCADYAGGAADTWFEMITGETIPPTTLSNVKKRVPKLRAYRAAALREP